MLIKRKTRTSGPLRTQRRGGFKRIIAPLSSVLALTTFSTLGVVANGPAGPASAATKPAAAVSTPKGWRLAFSSNFSGSGVNTNIWGECYPWANASVGCTNFGNTADQEYEWYQESQVQVKNGVLDLVAQREPTNGENAQGQPEEYDCRSGMVTTFPGFQFEYGAIRITARLAYGLGLWSAFWLAAADEQWPPEVDILEHWSSETVSKAYLHPVSGPRQGGQLSIPNADQGWHTFSLSWTKTRLTWWFDGKQVMTTTTGIPQQAMYLILNLADDNNSAGGCNGSLEIKSVYIWQQIN